MLRPVTALIQQVTAGAMPIQVAGPVLQAHTALIGKDSFATGSVLRSVSQLLLRNKGRVLSIKMGLRLGEKIQPAQTNTGLQLKALGSRSPALVYQRHLPAFQAQNHVRKPVYKTKPAARHIPAKVLAQTLMASPYGALGS